MYRRLHWHPKQAFSLAVGGELLSVSPIRITPIPEIIKSTFFSRTWIRKCNQGISHKTRGESPAGFVLGEHSQIAIFSLSRSPVDGASGATPGGQGWEVSRKEPVWLLLPCLGNKPRSCYYFHPPLCLSLPGCFAFTLTSRWPGPTLARFVSPPCTVFGVGAPASAWWSTESLQKWPWDLPDPLLHSLISFSALFLLLFKLRCTGNQSSFWSLLHLKN